MNFAAFILSTGRCGTQWIAKTLADAYSDHVAVDHEPLHNQYDARKALASIALASPLSSLSAVVRQHMDSIEGRLETQSYIECGHPNWSTIPYLAERFRGRVRIIHLTRHPVPTCYSWLTHSAFQDPLLPHLLEKTLLSPFDEGTRFQEYRRGWEALSPFEKCLFYWSEVNAFAIDLQSRQDAPWLRLRYEDLFHGEGLGRLLEFLDLPHREGVFSQTGKVVDNYCYSLAAWQDWRIIRNHPRAMSIANELKYTLDEIDEITLYRRYLGGPQADET